MPSSYDPQYDSNGVPQQVDSAVGRYIAKGFAGITMGSSQYVPTGSSQACGKNPAYCVIAGWNLTGTEANRRGYVYIKNVGADEAIIDLTVNVLYVRRG